MGVKKLILEGEGVSLDFKQTITSCEKIARTMVSFANRQGGNLLIGVANDGRILGVKSEEEEKYMILKAAHNYSRPVLEPIFEEIYIDDKIILRVDIKESCLKPHYAFSDEKKWQPYIRIKDKSILADDIVVEVLKSSNIESEPDYLSNEKALLKYLESNERITLMQYSVIHNLSLDSTRAIFVNLMLTGVIQLHTTGREAFFTAS